MSHTSGCDQQPQTGDAARAYAGAAEVASTYVLAEHTDRTLLQWGKPEERRTIQASHNEFFAGGIMLPPRQRWEQSHASANGYPKFRDTVWTDEQLVVEGCEMHSDPPCFLWIALHPAVGYYVGWTPDRTDLFCWHGDDGAWRARSIRRARGQLSRQASSHTYCAEGWQVVLSDIGLAELRQAFSRLRRELLVQRTLPARPREDRPINETSDYRVPLKEWN